MTFKIRLLVIVIILLVAIGFFVQYNKTKIDIASTSGEQVCRLSKELYCNEVGQNCKLNYSYKYDDNGNKIKFYHVSYNSTLERWIHDFELGKTYQNITYYDNKDRVLLKSLYCDDNFKNCRRITSYEYDDSGNKNLLAQYENCKPDVTDCRGTIRYTYDSNNNKIAEYFEGSKYGVYNGKANKYEYDQYGKNTVIYEKCEKNLENCKQKSEYKYDSYGNKIEGYMHCNINSKECPLTDRYTYIYDDNGNIIMSYYQRSSYKSVVTRYIYECK